MNKHRGVNEKSIPISPKQLRVLRLSTVSSAQKRNLSNIQTELPLGGDGLLTFYQKGKCNHYASSLDKHNQGKET